MLALFSPLPKHTSCQISSRDSCGSGFSFTEICLETRFKHCPQAPPGNAPLSSCGFLLGRLSEPVIQPTARETGPREGCLSNISAKHPFLSHCSPPLAGPYFLVILVFHLGSYSITGGQMALLCLMTAKPINWACVPRTHQVSLVLRNAPEVNRARVMWAGKASSKQDEANVQGSHTETEKLAGALCVFKDNAFLWETGIGMSKWQAANC